MSSLVEDKNKSLVAVTHVSHDGDLSPPETQRKWELDKYKLYFHVCENILPDLYKFE